jgi:hypothetical protein
MPEALDPIKKRGVVHRVTLANLWIKRDSLCGARKFCFSQ